MGVLTLLGARERLRRENLYATEFFAGAGEDSGLAPPERDHRFARTSDGTYNDLARPLIGSAGTRFGRNVPPKYWHPENGARVLQPNPRLVSRLLLTREEFLPATTLNVLAAAWIQMEVHDWVFHGKNEHAAPFEVHCEPDDQWPEKPMQIQRSHADSHPDNEARLTYTNTETHWWDASQIYTGTRDGAARRRSGEFGQIALDEYGLVPVEREGPLDYSIVPGAMWLGLAILQSVFMREHNAVCQHLHAHHPALSDDELYEKGRLVVSALMAKIHTVEWTPAIIAHPTTVRGMNTSWWGLTGDRLHKRMARMTRNTLLTGIPGSATNDHGVPHSLTEEFVSVYRMHPLIPDDYVFRSVQTDDVLQERTFPELNALEYRQRLGEIEMADALYSLGVAFPGAITLHNFPRHLQEFHRPDGALVDLAATDILRARERGVPRYNEFRRLFHRPPVESFEELSDSPMCVEEIRAMYEGEIEDVDLMIGLFAEPKPAGFGFSDTAFRVFLLMAGRRLEADRFFTRDYRPEVYTPEGLQWIERETMRSVLLRHFPGLAPALRGVENAFTPWRRVTSA